MNARSGTARSVGAFFLFSNVTFILGALVLVEPLLGAPDYLTLVSAKRTQVILGVWLIVKGFSPSAVLSRSVQLEGAPT